MKELKTAIYLVENNYGLSPLTNIRHMPGGRVNLTFLVEAAGQKFILQRLHPVFGLDGGVVENLEAINASLTAAGLACPRVIKTRSDQSWVLDREKIWRLISWLPGTTTSQADPARASLAGDYLGLFHRALQNSPPGLNPPPALFRREGPLPADAWSELNEQYRDHAKHPRARSLLERGLLLTRGMPAFGIETRAFVHGDPKLDNFLFDDDGRVTGLIDLDVVHQGGLIWDLADGLRSWAGRRQENDLVTLDRKIYLAAVQSYSKSGLAMSNLEWARLPRAIQAVALKLAWRYLTDYFEENYFAWDRVNYPSLAEQNLRRGLGMLSLAEDIEAAAKDLQRGSPKT